MKEPSTSRDRRCDRGKTMRCGKLMVVVFVGGDDNKHKVLLKSVYVAIHEAVVCL